MIYQTISPEAIQRRRRWLSEIVKISGNFGQDYTRVEVELTDEINTVGVGAILDHLRLGGVIPEEYGHDTSEEKLYSKYTDALLAVTFRSIGLRSIVLTERADAADVEVFADNFSFVADAKAFRLTRTAKNQKDFKMQAMDGWRRDKTYAIVVAPLYQMPSSNSQIYLQAITRDVCLLSYSHLAVLVQTSQTKGHAYAQDLLKKILTAVAVMHPTKDAKDYWSTINSIFLGADETVVAYWKKEKIANLESIEVAKVEGLLHYEAMKTKILSMSHDEAIKELLHRSKIDSKIKLLGSISDNKLIEL